ncbi:hypothetical protein CLV56_2800 [Mumia flava]|uniref:Uncharacterized protein n=1 Tax=Mumia flava TaxID=1348852 RepID=A0A0B2BI79_9ACTN|nr:hypothetical protein [Mumia flava]PJJ58549.1 hypothetical protein CLV56_2800 [Mumia flava]
MTWSERLADLESDLLQQAEGADLADRDRLIDELAQERSAEVSWVDRCLGTTVQVRVNGAGVVRGELALATAQWILVHHDALTDWVVSLDQVASVRSDERSPALARGEVQRRLSWRYAWAALHRDADEVHVILIDGSTLYGAPTRVGKDYVEIAGEIVPFASVVALRCPR